MTSRQVFQLLRRHECRNVTYLDPDGTWPIVWERATGVHVWDSRGRKYLDLTAAFGVAAAGHANPQVVRAGQRQMAKLLHAMGDVHPHAAKAQLARELSRITFERWSSGSTQSRLSGKTIFCNSGFEAVEAALKTALLATDRRGIIAFEGGYHGLGYGALNATHRRHFRDRFVSQLGRFGHFVPFPGSAPHPTTHANRDGRTLDALQDQLEGLFRRHKIGAIVAEPVQARGGINVPPPDFLPLLRRLCSRHGALLVFDEIFTGFGRTGKWFACEHTGVVPDIVCLGKALTGGFPLSACVGRAEIMDAAWPESTGEAIHTSTFLGHPVGCAMALAQIKEIRRLRLPERSLRLGKALLASLVRMASEHDRLKLSPRGTGLMTGLELRDPQGRPATRLALEFVKRLLRRGFILLPEGVHSNVISFTPPLIISQHQLMTAVECLDEELQAIARS